MTSSEFDWSASRSVTRAELESVVAVHHCADNSCSGWVVIIIFSYSSRSDDHDMSMIDCPAYGVRIPGLLLQNTIDDAVHNPQSHDGAQSNDEEAVRLCNDAIGRTLLESSECQHGVSQRARGPTPATRAGLTSSNNNRF